MMFKHILMNSAAVLMLAGCDNSGKLSEQQKTEVKEVTRAVVSEILEKEPERFVAAIDRAVQNQQRLAAQKIEKAATDSQSSFWEMPLVLGNKEAKLKLAVFIDPLDPVSQKFRSDVMEPIANKRSDVGFFLIPVSIYGGAREGDTTAPSSVNAAQALIAAAWQDPIKALVLWTKMPDINKEFSQTKMNQIAESVGLKVEKLTSDMNSEEAHKALVGNGQLAVNINIPLQLPIIFIRKTDGAMNMIPPFIESKMITVLDDVLAGKPWDSSLVAHPETEENPANAAGKPAAKMQESEAATPQPAPDPAPKPEEVGVEAAPAPTPAPVPAPAKGKRPAAPAAKK